VGDAEAALAFVAGRQGRRSMPATDWANVLSFDLGWMPPAAARGLVDAAQGAGLLEPDGESLRLTIDPASVPIPPLFRPRPDARPDARVAAPPPDGFLAWLLAYERQAGCDRAEALRRVALRQAEAQGLLTADAALLWLGAEAGLDVRAAARRLIAPAGPAAPVPP
jgi:hypothetical protein